MGRQLSILTNKDLYDRFKRLHAKSLDIRQMCQIVYQFPAGGHLNLFQFLTYLNVVNSHLHTSLHTCSISSQELPVFIKMFNQKISTLKFCGR